MNKPLLKQKIRQYIELSRLAASYPKGEDINSLLISAIIDLEEEILIQFGLPLSAYKFTSQMEYYGQSDGNTADIVNELYRWLKNEAITYLSSPVKSNIGILIEGKEKMLHANEVIPFTGYATTSYNSFVYYDVFCRNLCSAKELMLAISTAEGVSEFDPKFELLPFAEYFFEYRAKASQKNKLASIPVHTHCQKFESAYPVAACLIINSFFITGIAAYDKQTCIVECAVEFNKRMLQIKIWCTIKHLRYILQHSKYLSDVASVLLALRHHNFSKKPYLFEIGYNAASTIEIVDIDFELERLDRKTDEVQQPYSFIISYLPDHSIH
ncbi:MAG: hypothetical protein WC756_06600 [Taibaiella sp.]|jgi:hypothetical protein